MKRNRIIILTILLAFSFCLSAQVGENHVLWPQVNIPEEIIGGWRHEKTSFLLSFYQHGVHRDNQTWPYQGINRKGKVILLTIVFRDALCKLELIPQGYDSLKVRCQWSPFLPSEILEGEFIVLSRANPAPMTPLEFRERAINYSKSSTPDAQNYEENIKIPATVLSKDWAQKAVKLKKFPDELLGHWQEVSTRDTSRKNTKIFAIYPNGIFTRQYEKSMYPIQYAALAKLYGHQNTFGFSPVFGEAHWENTMWMKYRNDTLITQSMGWGEVFGTPPRVFKRISRLQEASLPSSLLKLYEESYSHIPSFDVPNDPPGLVQLAKHKLRFVGHRLNIIKIYQNKHPYNQQNTSNPNYDILAVDPKTGKEFFFTLLFNQRNGAYLLYAFGVPSQFNGGTLHVFPKVFQVSGDMYSEKQVLQILGAILSPVALVLALLFLRNRRIRRQRQQAQLALRGIRAQLNPHFLFNALASIQSLVNRNDQEGANRYLSGFSKLLRHTLYHSEQDYISLEEELAHLRQYCELEALRSPFEYTIKVAENLDVFNTEVPGMLLQPYVENAILHGLREHPGQPKLEVWIHQQGKNLRCEISDNGQGIKASLAQQKNTSEFAPKLHGMGLSAERIRLLNLRLRKKITLEVVDRQQIENQSGTRIILNIPQ